MLSQLIHVGPTEGHNVRGVTVLPPAPADRTIRVSGDEIHLELGLNVVRMQQILDARDFRT